jgi:ribosomal protein S18 acetylase RimI-like enzyme
MNNMTISIAPANEGKALDEFIALPSRLYAKFPEYVPPLKMDREGVLRPDKAAFFKHGIARYWLAYRDGKAIGRISAQIDHSQPPGVFDDAGLFGCLDAIDDQVVIRKLLETAEAWLREQGRSRVAGPFLLSINGEPGLLVEGRSEPPLIMVPWHPAYLEKHLVANGYTPAHDLHYWRLDDLPQKLAGIRDRRRLGNRLNDLTVRKIDMKNLPRDLEIMRTIYNDAWKNNWGFVPLEKVDLDAISTDLKPFVKPEFGFIVEKAGQPIAVAMMVPNLYEITSDIGPNPSILGFIKLGLRMLFHQFRTGHAILLGVNSEFRHSIGGAMVAFALVDEMIERFANYRHQSGWFEGGWVLEDNIPLQKILESYGFEKKRTLRLFNKEL